MKKNIFIILISCISVIIIGSCQSILKDYTKLSITCLSVIMSDGSEQALSGANQATSFSVLRADSLKIVAVVMALGTDSVQILYTSSVYGNGYETRITSLSNYTNYESHRIKTFLNAPK